MQWFPKKKIEQEKKPWNIFKRRKIYKAFQLSWIIVCSTCLMWESLWPSEQETYGSMFNRALTCLRVILPWKFSPSPPLPDAKWPWPGYFPSVGFSFANTKGKRQGWLNPILCSQQTWVINHLCILCKLRDLNVLNIDFGNGLKRTRDNKSVSLMLYLSLMFLQNYSPFLSLPVHIIFIVTSVILGGL